MKIVSTKVELLDNKPYEAILDKIETAGKTCYKSPKKDDIKAKEQFVRGIIKRGHESVIEHECLTFKVITDRAIANEIVRHRLASYSQQSSRYVNLSNLRVVLPLDIDCEQSDIGCEMLEFFKQCEDIYRKLIELGATKDVARSVLPLATATELVITMNFRSLRHFLKLRMAKSAHRNIREVARQIYDILEEKYPDFVEDLKDLRWKTKIKKKKKILN